jgi:hypothetical protein
MLFNTGLSLVQLVLVLAVCGFALWQRGWIRIVLSLCIIIWAVFTLQYDVKIAGTLIALGTLLFFEGILGKVNQAREANRG